MHWASTLDPPQTVWWTCGSLLESIHPWVCINEHLVNTNNCLYYGESPVVTATVLMYIMFHPVSSPSETVLQEVPDSSAYCVLTCALEIGLQTIQPESKLKETCVLQMLGFSIPYCYPHTLTLWTRRQWLYKSGKSWGFFFFFFTNKQFFFSMCLWPIFE